eukprot:CAMPEP_0202477750 /NCGR_PEP_ID=MMETSP1360-20130828/94103_1 /ASSEMBLY_ACC=CAM_ASM_000848 /TAXON_ID=515479 /ORGANISM="Licmophora paradoxa, Strain CCMP2313" /LENGTH=158 /DNA_ID=CAMNT_0049105001 /DNA_START=333 /DNA_END=809 /DNA_ORIENTATION=-
MSFFIEEVISSEVIGVDEEVIPFPSREFKSIEVVVMCMERLSKNNAPYKDAGLETCWNFASDMSRASQGGSLERFIEFASNPSFSSMVNAKSWSVVSTGPLIEGTNTRGPMQTCRIRVAPAKGDERDFVWMLQRERRPPRQDCWLIHQCIQTDTALDD